MLRFGFIIPFRPKSESVDWEEDNALLERTVSSILRQTYPHLQIYVLYTDVPNKQLTDERLTYTAFPYGHQSWNEIQNRHELLLRFKSETKAMRRWDKARKLCYGSKLAKEGSCDYIMALDSDDLLSKHFLSYLVANSRNKSCAGWYMDKGYLYKQGAGFLIRVPRYMCGLNGSTHVLRSDLVLIPDFDSVSWMDYSLFTDHGWVRERIRRYYNETLEPVSRAMLVYVVHRSNMSQVHQKEYGFHLKAIVKRLLRSVPLTRRLKEEFGIDRY
jgi:hypothetical protein